MGGSVQAIGWQGLVLASLPTIVVIVIMWRWAAGSGTAIYANLRMLAQLLVIGYVLVYVFEAGEPSIVLVVLAVMIVAASWIAIRPLTDRSQRVFLHALVAIAASGVAVLALVSQAVIGIDPWFSPRYLIPLAGMIFSGAMNTVSLAAERLFAVGLVALPGMMTGQILSGVSPVVAAKYQIVVMLMLFGVTGLSAAIFITLERRQLESLASEAKE